MVDDKYFTRLGADNASRPDDLPPSQGGKYSGFGNMPTEDKSRQGGMLPLLSDVQKDPMSALTKGFSWFASTVSKTAKTVNDGYIQPTAKSIAEGEFVKQAQLTAAQIARQAQLAGKNAQEGFNKLVEGPDSTRRTVPLDASRREFWDNFSSLADQPKPSSAIGTSAIGMGKKTNAGVSALEPKSNEWDDW